ncbi:unnamed protein product [Mytilus coruscus]|uniref:Reverse transcriptase zinc-binding domain-containing protein n=1 Tax=Mytilus coruscus TaxID=42192 RepID=A0A6J8DJE8_MYTCO|nr:unnamed protein product [Mytilus coruscus]
MLNAVNNYSNGHQYTIHPTKSVLLKQNITSSNTNKESILAWELGERNLTTSDRATHLGITRSSKNENMLNIEERISLARRTSYSLMKTGVHGGTNGLNSRISYTIYKIYILPRLLYSLEVLPLNLTQLKALSDFHLTFLRNIQSLPTRTASIGIYSLLGALPLEAELHKRQLSLLHSISVSENQNLKEILLRQYHLQINQGTFLERIEFVLQQYNLPTIEELWDNTPSKFTWKHTVRSAISDFWNDKFRTEIAQKSTLNRLDTNSIKIGETHPVWNSALNIPDETKRAIVKARILTGTYMLQSNKAKFGIDNVDATCPICFIEDENLIHFITRCPAFEGIRRNHYGLIKQQIVLKIGNEQWNEKFRNRDIICQLITDCTKLAGEYLQHDSELMNNIETISRKMCYDLHVKRLNSIYTN